MTTAQLPLGLAQPHRNQQLFADHYLDVVLLARPEWQALREPAAAAQTAIRAIFEHFTPSGVEAQTEEDLIKPVLAVLGHTVEVQAALRAPRGTRKPDYIFYQDAAARAANKDQVLTADLVRGKAFAVGDAKHWDRPLDVSLKVRGGDPELNRVPSDQIAFYMLHSGATWGILTNGRLWRLYHTDTAQQQERYYEVDLEALTRHGSPEDFRYFYAFFRRAAFDDQPLGVADILRESTAAARAIGDGLRRQVYDALRHLAQGFLDYRGNQLTPDPTTLKQIYDNSLTVLYRLLFVLYAEARELLPLRASPAYRNEHSLFSVARDVATRIDSGRSLLPTGSALWARLRDLCDIINEGSPPLQVATFNGGLFDPQRHRFLVQHTVGDARLASAIDLLTRLDGEIIDYRDLAERHLGTIYEGLLEQHLSPIAPTADGWTIDLLDSAGARHRSGSYYTPDFVVQYILAQTLRPVLEQASAPATTDAERVAAVLAVNVCDPAMGSGHFLVGAMEYIARYLLELGVSPDNSSGEQESDLAFWKRRVAQSCIYGVDLNPLAVELAKLSLWLATAAKDRPLSFLDHHLRCGNALVGARLTDLQQRPQQPTSATRRAQKQAAQLSAAGQTSMLDDDAFRRSMSLAVDSLWLIESSPARTVADVKQQEAAYLDLRAELARQYLKVADLYAALRLGLVAPAELHASLVDYVAGKSLAALPKVVELAEQARALIAEHRPLHWELEFPEVFFDRHGQPLGDAAGFDAVVGNPPYVRQELLAPLKPYLQDAFAETYHGVADLYVYFYQRGVELLQPGGRMAYIVTNKWMRAGYGESLRGYFAENAIIHEIIDFGHAPIFAEADVFPCIVVLERPFAPHPPNPLLPWWGDASSSPHPPTPSPTTGRGGVDAASSPHPPNPLLPPAEARVEGMNMPVERWEVPRELDVRMRDVARAFRKEPTPSEALLWEAVRGGKLDGFKFRRQQPIGPFVVDFFCATTRLIVEVDGPIHQTQYAADRARQELLESLGFRVLRVTAHDVEHNLDQTVELIRATLRVPHTAEEVTPSLLLPAAPVEPHSSPLLPAVGEGGPGGMRGDSVRITIFPREALGTTSLEAYVAQHSLVVPRRRFGRTPWSLEANDVDDLMEKLRRMGVPLAEFAGVKPYYGIKTGLNEAFLIDTPTRERLVREDPRSAEIIKPYLRGQDIKRWSPEWDGLWMIVLKSSENHRWPWSDEPTDAEQIFAQTYPGIFAHFHPLKDRMTIRQDKGRYWWELRSCSYYEVFDRPKLIHTDITWRAQFAYVDRSMYLLNTAYVWPIEDLYVLSVLNSPVIWALMWRTATHGKDEALRLIYSYVETLPIAPPTEAQRAEVEPAVQRLIAITGADQHAHRDTLDWLRTEFGVESPGQKLAAFSDMDEAAFIEEVRKRRPRTLGKLTPAGLRALRDGYAEQAQPIQERRREALALERRLAAIVNDAYGLTPEEVELLWRTAPPRMPVGR